MRTKQRTELNTDLEADEALVYAALELFAAQGYQGTSLRQIAAHAGLDEAEARSRFPNTRALYRELYERHGPISSAILRVNPSELSASTPDEALPPLIEEIVLEWAKRESRLFVNMYCTEADPEEYQALAEGGWLMYQVFDTWRARGLVRGDIDVELLAWELFAPLAWLRMRYLGVDGDLEVAKHVMRDHLRFFLTVTKPAQA